MLAWRFHGHEPLFKTAEYELGKTAPENSLQLLPAGSGRPLPTSTGKGGEGSAVMCQRAVAAVGCWRPLAEPAYPLKLAPVSATHWLSGSRQ
jgi:hypothetical protein